jgi:hypothetical protein
MSKKRLVIIYGLGIALMTTLIGFVPGHNGDLPFYIACSLEMQGVPHGEVREQTKMILRQELPPAEYAVHAGRVDDAAPGILNFYYVKPAYIWLEWGFHKLGFSYIFATLLPSLIAYFFMGWIVLAWALAILKPWQALLIGFLLMLTGPAMVIARLSSPDGLSSLVLLGVLYRLYFEKTKGVTLLLIFLSVLVRIDNAVAALILLSAMAFWPSPESPNRLSRPVYAVLLTAMLFFTAAINFLVEKDFWWFTQANYLQSGGNYFRQMVIYLTVMSDSFLFLLLLLIVILGFVRPFSLREKDNWLLAAIGCIVLIRCGLFPEFEERFFACYYLAGILILADKVLRIFGPGKTLRYDGG